MMLPAKLVVSIHAPARGATQRHNWDQEPKRVSIHAPARGATSAASRSALTMPFQSTRPHGARLSVIIRNIIIPRFNPRARTGRDNKGKGV